RVAKKAFDRLAEHLAGESFNLSFVEVSATGDSGPGRADKALLHLSGTYGRSSNEDDALEVEGSREHLDRDVAAQRPPQHDHLAQLQGVKKRNHAICQPGKRVAPHGIDSVARSPVPEKVEGDEIAPSPNRTAQLASEHLAARGIAMDQHQRPSAAAAAFNEEPPMGGSGDLAEAHVTGP